MTNPKQVTPEDRLTSLDRMRFVKNKLSANMALLAIVFNVLYFVCIYKSDVSNWYYQPRIGVSIVYNLVFMLLVFLASEGVKTYHYGYAWVLVAVGVGQIIRIFILPTSAHMATYGSKANPKLIMETPQYIRTIIYLSLSAACCLIGGIVGIQRSHKLNAYLASVSKAA